MRNPGLQTGRDVETYDVGPGTPHGVWPLEAANNLEPGGTATRHLLSTLSGYQTDKQETFTRRSIPHYSGVFIDLEGQSEV